MMISTSVRPERPLFVPARLEQKPEILAFQRSAISAIPDDCYEDAAKAAWWRTPAMGLDKLIASGRYFVVALNGRLVAGAGWEPYLDDKTAMLRAVFVDPRYSGMGLGVRAVWQIEDEVRKTGRSVMIVPSALNAVGFYEKLGYERLDRGQAEFEGGILLDYQKLRKSLVPPRR